MNSPDEISGITLCVERNLNVTGPSGSVGDGGSVSTWGSNRGPGYNLTQSDDAKRLRFSTAYGLQNEVGQNRSMSVTGVPVNKRGMTIVFVGRLTSSRGTVKADTTLADYQFLVGTAANTLNLFVDKTGKINVFADGAFKLDATSIDPHDVVIPSGRCVFGASFSATAWTAYANGKTRSYPALAAGSTNGVTMLNGGDDIYPSQGDFDAIYFYDHAFTPVQWQLIQDYAERSFDLPHEKRFVNVVAGDSISQGFGTTGNKTWVNVRTVNTGTIVYNRSLSGQTLAQLTTSAATEIDPLIDPYAVNVLEVFAQTNDIAAGQSAAAAYAAMVAFCNARRAAGWSGRNKIVIYALLPRTGVTDSIRTTLRASMLGDFTTNTPKSYVLGPTPGVTYADFYVDSDTASISRPDGIHPVNAGHAILGTYSTAVHSLLPGAFTLERLSDQIAAATVVATDIQTTVNSFLNGSASILTRTQSGDDVAGATELRELSRRLDVITGGRLILLGSAATLVFVVDQTIVSDLDQVISASINFTRDTYSGTFEVGVFTVTDVVPEAGKSGVTITGTLDLTEVAAADLPPGIYTLALNLTSDEDTFGPLPMAAGPVTLAHPGSMGEMLDRVPRIGKSVKWTYEGEGEDYDLVGMEAPE